MDLKNIIENHEASAKAKKILWLGAWSVLLAGAITGIPAVFMGHRELAKHGNSDADRRAIIGGMVLGYIGVILTVFLVVILMLAVFGDWNLSELINIELMR